MNEMNVMLNKTLLKHERVLWSGQPKQTALFTQKDVLLIPLSVMWGGFAIYWELSLLWGQDESGQGAPILFILLGLPFAIFGLYSILGRFIYKIWSKYDTLYAVTNRRIIVIHKTKSSFQTTDIRSIPGIIQTNDVRGLGTVKFSKMSSNRALENTGMDFFDPFIDHKTIAFYDIPDAGKVYQIVSQIKGKRC